MPCQAVGRDVELAIAQPLLAEEHRRRLGGELRPGCDELVDQPVRRREGGSAAPRGELRPVACVQHLEAAESGAGSGERRAQHREVMAHEALDGRPVVDRRVERHLAFHAGGRQAEGDAELVAHLRQLVMDLAQRQGDAEQGTR